MENHQLLIKKIYQYCIENKLYVYETQDVGGYAMYSRSRTEIKIAKNESRMMNIKDFEIKMKNYNLLQIICHKENEVYNLWSYLSKDKNIQNTLIQEIEPLTQGFWKKNIAKYLNCLTENNHEKMNILLTFSNTKLPINEKNFNIVQNIIKDISKEEQIIFWKQFFNKRKKALNNNNGATKFINFIKKNFSNEIIKNEFMDLSKYVRDLFEEKNNKIDLFQNNFNYIILKFNCKNIENILLIPGFSSNKIKQQIFQITQYLSNIKNFHFDTIEKNFNQDMKIVIQYNHDNIQEEKIKTVMNDYLWELKQNKNIDYLKSEESFKKWLLKYELNEELENHAIQNKVFKI